MDDKWYFTEKQLVKMQNKPLDEKIQISVAKILQLINLTKGKIYVAYSGGKDSGVLLDLVAKCWTLTKYKDEPLTVAFANTTCELAGMIQHIKEFIKFIENRYSIKIDFHLVNPDTNYREVIQKVGYPVATKQVARKVTDIRKIMKNNNIQWADIKDHLDSTVENAEYLRALGFNPSTTLYLCGVKSNNTKGSSHSRLSKRWLPLIYAPFETSHKCCDYLKKKPQKKLGKELNLSPIIGEMASESSNRKVAYMKTGCVYETGNKYSAKPMGFWTEQDIYRYYLVYDYLPLFKIYGKVIELEDGTLALDGKMPRTGCKLCLFGCAYKHNGIHVMKNIEPQTCKIALKPVSEGGFGYLEVINYLNAYCNCDIDLGQEKYGQMSLFEETE